jgi:hypothetical protein
MTPLVLIRLIRCYIAFKARVGKDTVLLKTNAGSLTFLRKHNKVGAKMFRISCVILFLGWYQATREIAAQSQTRVSQTEKALPIRVNSSYRLVARIFGKRHLTVVRGERKYLPQCLICSPSV